MPATAPATAGTTLGPHPEPGVLHDVLTLAGDPDRYHAFERQAARVGQCAHPIRLRGRIDHADVATGEVRQAYATDTDPDGVLLVPCGNRRAAVCPACAETYRADAYQLIRAGLIGGKGVPDTIREHPAVFATFTAPSFGPVHASHADRGGRLRPCHPRRRARVCPHGVRMECRRTHPSTDSRVGEPLCKGCYDYTGHVLWNARAPELWRYTTEYLRRGLARAAGLTMAAFKATCSVQFIKVAEYQARGVIHFHAIIRLDAAGTEHAPPPAPFTPQLLTDTLTATVPTIAVPVADPADPASGWTLRFGGQLDLRPIHAATGQAVTAEQVAGYIAKYATKHTETLGPGLHHRLDAKDLPYLERRGLRPHLVQLIRTAWTLGDQPHLAGLRLQQWAHQLGYGGHWSTRSRRYSTTMTALRQARAYHARAARWPDRVPRDAFGRLEDDAATVVLKDFTYAGSGWATEGHRWLAMSAAARAREHRHIARTERATPTAA